MLVATMVLKVFIVDNEVVADDEEDEPCWAIPCMSRVVYPPSLHHVRYEAKIPVAVGLNAKGMTIVPPPAIVAPTAGNDVEEKLLPTVGKLTL